MTWAIILLASFSANPSSDVSDNSPKLEALRAAVQRALPLIIKSTEEYSKRRDCFSCHHQAVPALALVTARERGFAVASEAIDGPVELTHADLLGALQEYERGSGQGGGVTRAGYALLTLELGGKKSDKVTDAVSRYLLTSGEASDHWRGSSNRPPSEASEFTATYVALRALATYGKDMQKDRIAGRVAKARKWLQ
jgi:hypothetical protein